MSATPTWITTAPLPLEVSGLAAPAAVPTHDALLPGTRLDEFEILRVLGAGGFGIVYLALDHVLMREVAIKEFMPAALAARGKGAIVSVRSASLAGTFATGLNSFFNEAQLLASFDHPALVKVYRFWKANGTAYMVMPYYPGQTLKEVRGAMRGSPDEAWLRALLEPLLGALDLLHREGVYHRDIAPDNILLLPDGRPVLLDFGSARRVIGDRTQALTAILKPNFAPIEQYADEAGMKQGPWTDLYALGATVHFVLTGRAPIPAVMRAVRDVLPALSAPDSAPFPGVATPFLAAIDWSLALAPEDRPQSVASIRQAFSGELVPPAPSLRHADLRRPRELEFDLGSRHGSVTPECARVDIDVTAPSLDTAADSLEVDAATTRPPTRRNHRATSAFAALFGLVVLAWGVWALSPSALPLDEAAAAAAAMAAAPVLSPVETSTTARAMTPTTAAATAIGATAPASATAGTAPTAAKAPTTPAVPAAGVRPVAVLKASLPAPTPTRAATPTPTSPPTTQRAPRSDRIPAADARAVAAGPDSPKQACGDLNFIALGVCVNRTCQDAAWRGHPQCVELRRVEDQRRRRMEQS